MSDADIETILGNNTVRMGWVDIPSSNMLDYIPELLREYELEEMITAYHAIPKDDYDKIPERCTYLKAISTYMGYDERKRQDTQVATSSNNTKNHRHLRFAQGSGRLPGQLMTLFSRHKRADPDFRTMSAYERLHHGFKDIIADELLYIRRNALSKMEYLLKLKEMHDAGILVSDESIFDPDKVRPYFENFDQPSRYKPISLKEPLFYSSSLREFGGCARLKCIDPSHRRLGDYKARWLEEREKGDCPPFFLWLESQVVEARTEYSNFLSSDERKACRKFIQDGKIMTGIGPEAKPCSTDNTITTIFVVIPDNPDNIILSREETLHIRHDSLSLGKALIGVGTWKVVDGEVIEVCSDSGNYLPREMAGQTVQVLIDMGIVLHDDVPFIYFLENTKIKTTIGEFLHQNSEISKTLSQGKNERPSNGHGFRLHNAGVTI